MAMAAAGLAPATGSEAGVQTANSLPRGFAADAAAYAQNRSMSRARAAMASNNKPRG